MIVMARRNRFHVRTGRFGLPRRTGQRMTAHDGGASAGKCDANIVCLRAPCFQVELETPHAHRQANACAYHVADVIQAVRAGVRWYEDAKLSGIREVVVDGDKIWARSICTGTDPRSGG